jgi:hypothetical protein
VWAHGPCACLTPASGAPGTTISAGTGAYKVVFNPDRTDLAIGPKSLWQAHRSGVVPAVVFRLPYKYSDLPLRDPVEFRVPVAPPGRYLVSIYDGSEGGSHYTWEYFRVKERRPPTTARRPTPGLADEATGVSSLTVVVVSVTAFLFGLCVGWLARARRRRSPVEQ